MYCWLYLNRSIYNGRASERGPVPLFSLAIRTLAVTADINIDPFFDDEEEGFTPSVKPGVPAYASVYKDPRDERLSNGASIINIAGAGPKGTRGVLIPHATTGGVPTGIDPNRLGDIQVNIDPQLPGQSTTLKLADLSDELMLESLRQATELVPDASTRARNSRRAATAFRIAQQAVADGTAPKGQDLSPRAPLRSNRSRVVRTTAPTAPAAPRGAAAAAPSSPVLQQSAATSFGPPPLPAKRKTGGFLSQFNKAATAAPLMDAPGEGVDDSPELFSSPVVRQRPQPAVPAIPQPAIQALFELPGFGQLPAMFHDITLDQETGQMTLVYDTRYTQGNKWFPPKPEEGQELARFAMQIVGRPEVYLVVHSGVQYAYQGTEFCTLQILEMGEDDGTQD